MIEPFFCKFFLYDIEARARVSETLEVDLNPDHVASMLNREVSAL